MSIHTPWGESQSVKHIADGIVSVSTASHGGYILSDERNRQMPDCLRIDEGWYEEDCDWALVAVAFPQFFEKKDVECATSTLRNLLPDQYEKHTGKVLVSGESREKDRRAWQEAHRNDYVVGAAWGDWHHAVPKEHVAVCAWLPGRRETEAYFIVPADEYEQRIGFGFVVDPSRHPRTEAIRVGG